MQIIFLGTGASGGTPGLGKSKRLESSILIKDDLNILIDVTRDFPRQIKNLKRIDAVFLTHGHMDACGGINKLPPYTNVFAHPKTLKVIQEKFKLSNLKLIPVETEQNIQLGSWDIIPYEVPHSNNSKFPTYAWKLNGPKIIIYASDIAKLTKKFKEICQGTDILIVDGATWKRKIFSHLRIDEDLPKLCKWHIEKIIVTQIGKSALPSRQLQKEITKICPKAFAAHDGLTIKF